MTAAPEMTIRRESRDWDDFTGELVFDKAAHTYEVAGLVVPGVTDILKAVQMLDTRFFTAEGRDRGTAVHEYTAWIEKGILDSESFSGNPYAGWVDAYRKFQDDTGWVSEELERPLVHSSYLWAGTPDRIGFIRTETVKKREKLWKNDRILLDIKTGSYQSWHPLQLEAYRMMAQEQYEFPGRLKIYALYLRKNGKYTLRECPGDYKDMWKKCVREYHGTAL